MMVVAAGSPVRLALVTAIGPVSRRTSSAISSSGMRRATVPAVSPRSQWREGWASSTRVSGPGHSSSMSRRAQSGTARASPSTVRTSGMRTGGGISRPLPFAMRTLATAAGSKASAPIP
ncbi:hypothetical protein B277_08085 [Janibacter hoylei PVAS-1]|uniref:Uncharacterized protein n=1 Tax=Janibacter hoylei PVAS-1 TaxID=1210046 RepID=K1EQ54_9MICO|nr:hypothetical protein B277_08085 [Janibacter hoylei PVAS-1]